VGSLAFDSSGGKPEPVVIRVRRVPQVFRLVKDSADGKDVAEYLHWLGEQHIGVRANREHDEVVAALLLAWRDHLAE
jgi:hypothetical protein